MKNKTIPSWTNLLEYASKALILYKEYNKDKSWHVERSRIIQTYNGTLTVVFNGRESWKQCSVKVGDTKNYTKFTQTLLTLLKEVTDKEFTLEDLTIK